MRLRALLVLAGIAIGTSGCRSSQPLVPATVPPAADPPVNIADSQRQQMATLSFLAYLGEDLKGADEKVEEALVPCMQRALSEHRLVAGWSLVWGPAVYKFSGAKLDDNMMYVVQNTKDPAHFAIVLRGTNAKAILDWLLEDFDVHAQVTWEYGPLPTEAKISKATSEGLLKLQTMTPEIEPGQGQTLTAFLTAQSKAHSSLRIDVTGHSLGGALAPTLALWLADTQADWASGSVQLKVYPLAGPTPGNLEFATYYDSRLGPHTDRMHNPKDVVPLTWNVEALETIADLYEPHTRPDAIERGLLDGLRHFVKNKGYFQIKPDAPALPGAVDESKTTFVAQVGWQHHCGYLCALGIDVRLQSDCNNPPSTPCGVCPQDSR